MKEKKSIKRKILGLSKSNSKNILAIFLLSIVYSIIYNLIDFIRNPVNGSFIDTLILFLLSIILVFIFFLALSLNKIIFNVITPLTMALSSIALYYILIYKIRIYLLDTFILLIQTDINEAMGVVSFELIIFVLITIIITIFFLKRYNKNIHSPKNKVKLLLLLLLSPLLLILFKSRIIMPYAFPYSIKMYNEYMINISKKRNDISKYQSSFNYEKNKDLVIVFIIGESARADHFSINGYKRETSPMLKKYKAISIPNIDSIYSVTNKCVPLMLTRATEENFEIASTETSFISIFNKHNFTTAWISYQDVLDNSYSNIAPLANEAHYKIQMDLHPQAKSKFQIDRGKMLDEVMIPEMEKIIKKDSNPKLIIMHSIGSHWNYNLHYPEKLQKFNPICTTSNVSRCATDELINSYDNSILYTDYFIANVIDKVKNMNSIVIYCSDHGEFLGENNHYGHIPGIRSKEITNPAMFVWMSQEYKTKNPQKYINLQRNKNYRYKNEILFHSIIDAADITGEIINPKLSIFRKK